jgi:hypothetical protein
VRCARSAEECDCERRGDGRKRERKKKGRLRGCEMNGDKGREANLNTKKEGGKACIDKYSADGL